MTSGVWLSRQTLSNLALLGATLLVFYLCWMLFRPFAAVITWALALSVFSRPAFLWLKGKLNSPSAGAAVTVLLAGVIILGPGVFLGNQLVREALEAGNAIKDALDNGGAQQLQERLEAMPRVKPLVDYALHELDLKAAAARAAGLLTSGVRSVLTGSTSFFTQFFLMLFFLFFLLRDFEEFFEGFRRLAPVDDQELHMLTERMSNTVYATIYGKFAAASAQGALGTLIFLALGIPAPLLWGSAMAIFGLIPMAGPAVIWIPTAIALAVQGAWIKALILAAWGIFAIGLVDNFVYPMIVGGRLRQHTLIAFISTFGGLLAFGITGLVIGPIVFALTTGLLDVWRARTGPATATPLVS